MSNKQIKRICKNCKIYNAKAEECSVIVLHEGERLKVPMWPEDKCMYETEYFDPTTKSMEDFAGNIQEVKFWVENEQGEKVDGDGIVKMEYPKGFFGKERNQ